MAQNADIVDVGVVSEAVPGTVVSMLVSVYNYGPTGVNITLTGVVDSGELSFTPGYIFCYPGYGQSFSSSFVMPNYDVKVIVYSWYWNGTIWVYDDQEVRNVKKKVVEEPSITEFKITNYLKV